MAFIEDHEETLLNPVYEVCSIPTKTGNVKILGDYSLENKKIELNDLDRHCAIFVPLTSYDFARGHLNSVSAGILNSERRIPFKIDNNYVFKVTLGEYLAIATLGNKKEKKIETPSTKQTPIIEENYRTELSVAAKNWAKNIRERNRYQPKNKTFSDVAKEISSGCCDVKGNKLRDIRDYIVHHVIDGARILGQKPGKVIPTKDGIHLDQSAAKQFSYAYQTINL